MNLHIAWIQWLHEYAYCMLLHFVCIDSCVHTVCLHLRPCEGAICGGPQIQHHGSATWKATPAGILLPPLQCTSHLVIQDKTRQVYGAGCVATPDPRNTGVIGWRGITGKVWSVALLQKICTHHQVYPSCSMLRVLVIRCMVTDCLLSGDVWASDEWASKA